MKVQKTITMTQLIYVILLAVFNLLVFTIFKVRTGVFWLSYAFMTWAFMVQITSLFLAFERANIETIFFGIPLASLSFYYLWAALFAGAVFMFFQQAGMNLALVIQVLILAAFLIVAIIALMARDVVGEIDQNIKTKVAALKSVGVDVEILMSACTDPELKASLGKLFETIKYSDPMTNETVAEVEQRVHRKISELRVYCEANQIEDAKKTCTELELLLIERNKKLLVSK